MMNWAVPFMFLRNRTRESKIVCFNVMYKRDSADLDSYPT